MFAHSKDVSVWWCLESYFSTFGWWAYIHNDSEYNAVARSWVGKLFTLICETVWFESRAA
ncbi:hypothetical protein SONE68_2172 [Lacticaseibacillus paracasei]|nr:hypothetical protein SONE68_2172 [Lacticaseibacillus paracasei]